MKRTKGAAPWNYKPLYKIGTKVIALKSKEIGIIKKIDNLCNWDYNKRAMPEYYIKWKDAWTRHECEYLDIGIEHVNFDDPIIILTSAAKLIYDKNDV